MATEYLKKAPRTPATGEDDTRRIVSEMLADVNALREGLAIFATAADQATTAAVAESMVRIVAGINRHHRELSECCDHVEVVVEIPTR